MHWKAVGDPGRRGSGSNPASSLENTTRDLGFSGVYRAALRLICPAVADICFRDLVDEGPLCFPLQADHLPLRVADS